MKGQIKYGQTIRWTNFWKTEEFEISVTGCDSLEKAKQIALEDAKQMGWSPRKWWRWWRRRDTNIKEAKNE
jgi:hypothetical protein